MSNIYFSSDLHFCHNRGFLYEPRGFSSIEEHDEIIVENWNKVVKPEDTVYLLGDIMLNDNKSGIEKLNQLNGIIYYIRGNHDTTTRCSLYREKTNMNPLSGFFETSWAAFQKINGYNIYMSHYPTIVGSLEDMSQLRERMLNFHGHTHSKDKFYQDIPFMYNVALDAHNNTPVSFDEIISDIKAKANECIAML